MPTKTDLMVQHGAVAGCPLLHLAIVDHVVVAATFMAALQLAVSPVGRLAFLVLQAAAAAFVIRPTGPDGTAAAAAAAATRFLFGVAFESFLPTEVAAVLEHVARFGVKGPEGALAGLVGSARYFDETVVE